MDEGFNSVQKNYLQAKINLDKPMFPQPVLQIINTEHFTLHLGKYMLNISNKVYITLK